MGISDAYLHAYVHYLVSQCITTTGRSLHIDVCLRSTEYNKLLQTKTENKKCSFNDIKFNFSKLVFVNSSVYSFQMLVFPTFFNTGLEFGRGAYNLEVAPDITRPVHTRARKAFWRGRNAQQRKELLGSQQKHRAFVFLLASAACK